MNRWVAPFAVLAGSALLAVAVVSLAIAALAVETNDAIYVTVGSRTFALPDASLGDFGTFLAEWQLLGVFSGAAGSLLLAVPRIRDRLSKGIAIAAALLALAAALQFAFSVSL